MANNITDEIFESVCQRIESTKYGLQLICDEFGIKRSTLYDVIDRDIDKRDRYTRAKERQADYLADLILDVAFDDADDEKDYIGVNHIQRDRLKVDSLKFIAAKLKPKVYGDKIDITTKGQSVASIPIVLKDGKTYEDLKNELEPE